jgi:GT2 family glycosyltransferase
MEVEERRVTRLAAVVTAYNRQDFVGICCQALCDAAGPDLDVQIFVMDNGSTDNTKAVAEAVGERVRVIRTEDNRWVVGVINRGFEAACASNPDYVLVLNDDTQFLPGALQHLVQVAEAHPNAVLTPLQLSYHKPGHIDANVLRLVSRTPALIEDAILGKPLRGAYPQRTIIGAAMLARAATWKHIGEFDELFWFTGSDDDYCNRAHFLGFEVLLVPGAHMYHAHGGLQPPTGPTPKAGIIRRYRLGLQARYMFQFKDPAWPLPIAALKATGYALGTFCACAARLWLPGMRESLVVFAKCAVKLPQIAATRKRHYDAAKKLR